MSNWSASRHSSACCCTELEVTKNIGETNSGVCSWRMCVWGWSITAMTGFRYYWHVMQMPITKHEEVRILAEEEYTSSRGPRLALLCCTQEDMERFILQLFLYSSFNGIALACTGARLIRSGGLSCYEQERIVRNHNAYRSQVALGKERNQPPAQNMLEMCWDDELAAMAQSWADNCVFEHDKNRVSPRFYVGQNLYKTMTTPYNAKSNTNPDFDRAITNWFNEVRLFQYTGTFSKATGHYSQLIWAETYLVGCGYSCYTNGTSYTRYYVCNYGPGGNYARLPYNTGLPACSHYGLVHSLKFSGLCIYDGCPTIKCQQRV